MELTAIQKVAVYAHPIIFAITVHEAAHGYVAKHFGDLTAYKQNRISLNPLRHIDPIGTIILPALTVLLGGILFGRSAYFPESMSLFVQQMGIAGMSINLSLMILNLIPLPPLDGGRIAVSLLPDHLAYKYAQVERYGFLILIILLMTHILDLIIFPLIQISQSLILWIFA